MPTQPGRDDSLRKRLRSYYRRTDAPCNICLEPIDYRLRSPDPWSLVVDHVVPLSRGGEDKEANCAAAHRRCNERKAAKLVTELDPRLRPYERIESDTGTTWYTPSGSRNFVTKRQWW